MSKSPEEIQTAELRTEALQVTNKLQFALQTYSNSKFDRPDSLVSSAKSFARTLTGGETSTSKKAQVDAQIGALNEIQTEIKKATSPAEIRAQMQKVDNLINTVSEMKSSTHFKNTDLKETSGYNKLATKLDADVANNVINNRPFGKI